MLRTRIVTAVVLLALLAGAALVSRLALAALCAAFLGMTLFEWLGLAGLPKVAAGLSAVLAALAGTAQQAAGLQAAAALPMDLYLPAVLAWIGIAALLVRAQGQGAALPRAALVALALALCAAAWFALLDLLRAGPVWTVSVLALVWLADIAAYFFGRMFGRAKLASRISPGKTWAGVWGAFGVVLGLAELLRWAWPQGGLWSTSLLRAAPLAGPALLALLVALSIVGDLFESFVKRQAGVKDSGWALPGHGGVWDRLDASLPVLPLAALVQWTLLPAASAGSRILGGLVEGALGRA
jgi:phosphatidate cytidylyltransferase